MTRALSLRATWARPSLQSRDADRVAGILDEIRNLTNGRGADVARVRGLTVPVKLAVDSVRKGGAVTLVGNVAPEDRTRPAVCRDAPDSPAGLLRIVAANIRPASR